MTSKFTKNARVFSSSQIKATNMTQNLSNYTGDEDKALEQIREK